MRLILKAWVLFFRVSKLGPCFTAIEEDGGDKRLVQLELACEADSVEPPDPVTSGQELSKVLTFQPGSG